MELPLLGNPPRRFPEAKLKIIPLALVLSSAAIGYVFAVQAAPQKPLPLTEKLYNAKSLELSFSVISPDAVPVKAKLIYSKPNRFRIESPDRLTVSDGSKIWDYDKVKKTYTEETGEPTRLTEPDVWPWAGFFLSQSLPGLQTLVRGDRKMIKKDTVAEWKATLAPPDTTETLYLDEKLGVPRGGTKDVKGVSVLTVADEIKLGDAPAADSQFTFTPPADAAKVAKMPPKVPFSKVASIFNAACVSCHGATGGRAGLNLTTYESVMAGGRSGPAIVPGKPDESLLLQLVKGTKRPKMPPGNTSLSATDIKTINDWILTGANP